MIPGESEAPKCVACGHAEDRHSSAIANGCCEGEWERCGCFRFRAPVEHEVIRCAGGCGEVVEEEGDRCTLCEDIAKDEAAGDDDYHRTRETEP